MKFVNINEVLPANTRMLNLDELYTDERWLVLGDLLPDGLIIVDPSGQVRYMNSAAESINEVYRVMVIGHFLEDFIQQSCIDCSALLDAFAESARINTVVQDANNRSYLISTRGYRCWSGETSAFMIVQRNLDALSKITRRSHGEPVIPAFTPQPPEMVATDTDPIISGEATTAVVNRGLRAIAMNIRLLILGESGVGKTELARLLHRRSGSISRPFVHVNCGSIPDSLFESEMFGYERGAFTGASSRGKKGLIEAADGGILFLDEVGEIPLHCQAKILQILEEGIIQRVGATASRRLRLQIIAATNRDLRALVEEGRFRRDLYYRLSVVTLVLPPLSARRELIPLLVDRFLTSVNQRRKTPLTMSADCRRHLLEYAYPGNVRELQNIIEYLGVVGERVVTEADLPLEQMATSPVGKMAGLASRPGSVSSPDRMALEDMSFPADFTLREAVKHYESSLIDAAIQKTGSKRKAAELLGVDIATVVRKSK
ncbi:MAG: sigma 54-interacting transcriptional regulator [Zoogloeaceae bacterium]|jgi:transcriptional regulator with PAS, ATPase and Fis domain|nr:sigma 54-interacting transcriptional regulator [Zoogloeaceae bacterium]